jgi:hypothetical protein
MFNLLRADRLPPDALPRPERARPADIIDLMTMYPTARRQAARVLAEIDAAKEGP